MLPTVLVVVLVALVTVAVSPLLARPGARPVERVGWTLLVLSLSLGAAVVLAVKGVWAPPDELQYLAVAVPMLASLLLLVGIGLVILGRMFGPPPAG